MMDVSIDPVQLMRFTERAQAAAPEEVCALMLGRRAGRACVVTELAAIANVAADPCTRFEVDPAAHLGLQRRARAEGLRILGVAHSHPAGPPEPSDADKAQAIEPNFLWLIHSLEEASSRLWWHATAGRFSPLCYGPSRR